MNIDTIIKNNVTNATLIKANRILKNGIVTVIENVQEHYEFDCKSVINTGRTYEISITFKAANSVKVFCTCPQHQIENYCKHITACLLFLNNSISLKDSTPINKLLTKLDENNNTKQQQLQEYLYPYLIEHIFFYQFTAIKVAKIKDAVRYQNMVQITSTTLNKSLHANVITKTITHTVELKKDGHSINAICSCGIANKLCVHTVAVMYYILFTTNNEYYLDTLIDTSIQQKALLHTVGLTPSDEQSNLFEFYFDKTELKIRSKQINITNLKSWNAAYFIEKQIAEKKKVVNFNAIRNEKYICILKQFITVPNIRWEPYHIDGDVDDFKMINSKINYNNFEILSQHCKIDADFIFAFTPLGVCSELKNAGYLDYFYNPENELRNLPLEKLVVAKNILVERFKNNIDYLATSNHFYTYTGTGHIPKIANLQKLNFSAKTFTIHLAVSQVGKLLSVKASINIGDEIMPLSAFTNYANILLIHQQTAYTVKNEINWQLLADFEKLDELLFPLTDATKLYKEYLLPLRKEISISLPAEAMPQYLIPEVSSLAVRLKEMEPDLLIFQPIILYDTIEAELDGEEIEVFKNDKLIIVQRDDEKETLLKNNIQALHPDFATQNEYPFFYITFSRAIMGGWFFDAIKKIAENGIVIYGQKELSKFKYNTNQPKLEIKGGSGIDWFDLKIEILFGDQIVPLKALRTAILNKHDFVQLGDGTMGLLPEEWIKKFKPLFQLGTIKKEDELQVSKFHYTLIEELHGAISEQSILNELQLKKDQLNQIDAIQTIIKPTNITATLRPYQLAGLNWLNQLYQIGWGGCLADDMGLGKTLQTLCFLQKLYNENNKIKILIVCPTSLIYNWQAEIDKFTTSIKYVIYHGGDRAFPKENSTKWNVLITSYGTLRNDIENFTNINFDITVLDESQSIKNPTSQITKAVQLIKTRIRFILSGTPVQNNTFDLYAQLNFCNPGLLGNQEYFKTEFANAIDKLGDKEKSSQLRKMLFPFILRRTKEQVAKDLPNKTETIMYCEMGKYQQKVYDAVKEEYKIKIMGKIEEVGMAKTAFLILEGLNKLRQICDCPSIVGGEDKKRFKQESIKLDELMREIEENISNHKMLIFSQFLGMLSLIKNKLDADGIKYIYLDGSVPAKERKSLVDKFQTDTNIQVFLISLKAGGVGLNLTAADYVYIIDPWWNPAVEDQAIDRTHRIGQTKKVFAYKMICKNTIEEKIILLQEKKKLLAKELISEDTSFVKKLTKEDVAWLLN